LNDVKRITGGRWYHTPKDRTAWKQMKEAFVGGVDRKWLIKKKEEHHICTNHRNYATKEKITM